MSKLGHRESATLLRPDLARLVRLGPLFGALAFGLPAGAGESPSYRVSVDSALKELRVRVCFPDRLPETLEPANPEAATALRSAVWEQDGESKDLVPGPRLLVPNGLGPGCVDYRVDLTGSLSDSRHGFGRRVPGAVLVSPRLFLWAPPGGIEAGLAGATLDFDLPAGMGVSAPWEPIEGAAGTSGRYALGKRPLGWDARVAIGRFERLDLALPGGRLDVALLEGDPPATRARIEPWLRANADALSRALDPAAPRLPVDRLQVLAVPTGTGGEPVPWGEVMRGGGDAVHLYIDQTQPQAAFLDDWVLIHELSHLLHPYMEGDGRWLYEGIASYYQNILPARAGWRTEREAWDRLHAGFRRGQTGTKAGQTLAEASRDMLRDRAFMRVYWSGAAIVLLADLELRQVSGGTQSLDWALAELRRREGPFDRGWGARELIAALDRVTDRRVFAKLVERWLDSDRFPDLVPTYRALGLEPTSDTEIRLSSDPWTTGARRLLIRGH